MNEILENIETIKFNLKNKKIKKFISFSYFTGGIIGTGDSFVKWKELLKYLFNSDQIPYDKHLFKLIQKIDYDLWRKWDIAFSYYEEMEFGLITKKEWNRMMHEVEKEIMEKYGNRLVKIEIIGVDKIYCLKPIFCKKLIIRNKKINKKR